MSKMLVALTALALASIPYTGAAAVLEHAPDRTGPRDNPLVGTGHAWRPLPAPASQARRRRRARRARSSGVR